MSWIVLWLLLLTLGVIVEGWLVWQLFNWLLEQGVIV